MKLRMKIGKAAAVAPPATSTTPRLLPTPKLAVVKTKDPSNVQPFYYRSEGLLFTATSADLDEKLVIEAIKKALTPFGVIQSSVEFEGGLDYEAGDPADLL